ncbi:uncharacterized protein LOC133201174 isoform X1 [Saccostrea echinata]|uniref:uncharacterized protein LOC133201174 isoform X1 n=1 Tax=Saccostrea echinata TaxID=191078 RepID=UPI002A83916B|nr:uncharacterized protein LOC133201174 isoform X1 [Saccostrea echinata]
MKGFGWLLFLVHYNGITGSIATFMFKQKAVKVSDILDLRPYFPGKSSRSPIECSRSCSRVEGCISMIYDKDSHECRIFKSDIAERKREESRDFDKKTPWVYYHIIKECGPDETFCPKEYSFTSDLCFCFQYFPGKLNHVAATLNCRASSAMTSHNVNRKTNLARIDSPAKQQKIEDYLRSIDTKTSGGFVFIQGEQLGNRWYYSDARTPLKYTNWAEGEGTNEDEEHIALSVTNFSWYSKDNESEYPQLCEIPPPDYLFVP